VKKNFTGEKSLHRVKKNFTGEKSLHRVKKNFTGEKSFRYVEKISTTGKNQSNNLDNPQIIKSQIGMLIMQAITIPLKKAIPEFSDLSYITYLLSANAKSSSLISINGIGSLTGV